MCPDKALLSAWYDGEVESPWKEEIDNHLAECERCRAIADELSRVSLFLQNDKAVVSRYKKKEIYRRVMHQHRRNNIISVWQRPVPWPAAAAAAVILGLALVFPTFNRPGANTGSAVVMTEETDLSALDDLIPVMLPPEQSLSYYGDSQLLKSASFERICPVMREGIFVGLLLFISLPLFGEDYMLEVKVNTLNGQGQPVWSNSFERVLAADESETFLFTASNGSMRITLSLHPIGDEEILLVAGSSFQLKGDEPSPSVSANLKSISLKKGEKVVYYPLGKNDENKEGGTLFSMELTVSPLEDGNI